MGNNRVARIAGIPATFPYRYYVTVTVKPNGDNGAKFARSYYLSVWERTNFPYDNINTDGEEDDIVNMINDIANGESYRIVNGYECEGEIVEADTIPHRE